MLHGETHDSGQTPVYRREKSCQIIEIKFFAFGTEIFIGGVVAVFFHNHYE